ncbi:hypothetical protein CIK05_08640 [Bdellovibrio sp. qaytius]|nr:hypothetical protein CIK05_08640 [Bdellovibrio sp. qaytius]
MGLNNTQAASPEVAAKEGWFDLLLPLGILIAFAVFLQWQQSNVENPSLWVTESRSLLRTGQYQKSLEYTLKLTHTFPKNHVYIDQAAILYNHLGDSANEAAMLEKFLVTAADPGEACPRLPHAYRALKNQKAMLDAAKRCLALEPKNSDFQFEMALSLERTGDLESALKIYEHGDVNYPGYIDFSIGVARIWLAQDKVEQAWRKIEPILKERPHLADAQIVAAKALLALNKKEQALEILNQAVDDHPNYEELKELKERIK